MLSSVRIDVYPTLDDIRCSPEWPKSYVVEFHSYILYHFSLVQPCYFIFSSFNPSFHLNHFLFSSLLYCTSSLYLIHHSLLSTHIYTSTILVSRITSNIMNTTHQDVSHLSPPSVLLSAYHRLSIPPTPTFPLLLCIIPSQHLYSGKRPR